MPAQPAAPADPLDRLRELHPAAIARAMQGERAEAWAIVLGRLDDNARAALQLYLDATARTAIEDARDRQEELARTSPALLATVRRGDRTYGRAARDARAPPAAQLHAAGVVGIARPRDVGVLARPAAGTVIAWRA